MTAAQLLALLRRSGQGDERAFVDVYDAVAPTAYRLALLLLRDPVLAAQVTQEVLLETWRFSATLASRQAHPLTAVLVLTRERASQMETGRSS